MTPIVRGCAEQAEIVNTAPSLLKVYMSKNKHGATWSLTGYFPKFNGPAMIAFNKKLSSDVSSIQKKAAKLGALSAKTAYKWEKLVLLAEYCDVRLIHRSSYIGCFETIHTENPERKKKAQLSAGYSAYEDFEADLLRAFSDVSDEFFREFLKRKKLKPIAFYLRRIRARAKFTMSITEEKLAAEMEIYGMYYWGGLYDKLSGKLEFEMGVATFW